MTPSADRGERALAKNVLGAVRRKFQPWNDPAAKPFIEFRAVTKRFGSFVAVDNQTLTIYEREFHALLGPSGCGKTTLLRMLAGFEEPTEGSIWLDGKPLSGVPPHKRPVNMMFQSYALFPHMTVEANVAFGLKQDRHAEAGDRGARRRDAEARQDGDSSPSASPTSFPAASGSAWRSPAPSPSGRRCCSSTSRSARSTRSSARRRSSS